MNDKPKEEKPEKEKGAGEMIKLHPEELRFIMEYRQLRFGQVIIRKHNGAFAGGETINNWDRQAMDLSSKIHIKLTEINNSIRISGDKP